MMTTPYVLKILELDIRTKVRFARSRSFGRNAKNRVDLYVTLPALVNLKAGKVLTKITWKKILLC